jgi:glutamate decarboxylase
MQCQSVSIVPQLQRAQEGEPAIGSATPGSSKATYMGRLAMMRGRQASRRVEGKDTLEANIIRYANARVARRKFARYFSAEARIPETSKSLFSFDPEVVERNVDGNDIGSFLTVSSSYTVTANHWRKSRR